ncbi:hypothetical protein F4801DRAFT_574863 [Xylaria longipes]|nr:hypothetical protein F4801DRAFT_574863 [Xylaria longipes]
MEFIGTVAATAQLLGMVMKILESISQLHDLIKHVPGRYHSWDIELTILGEMIYYIQRNSALQTFHVGRVIANIRPKIESLVLLCREHAPRPKSKPLKRVLTTLSACAAEPRILQRFESLEHDKITLLLAINLRIASNPLAIEDMSKRVYEEVRERSTEGPSGVHADSGPIHKTLVLVQKKDDDTDTTERRRSQAPGDSGQHHDMSSAHQYNTGEFVAPQQGIGRRSSYTTIKLVGNSIILGTSRGDGADFDGIDLNGYRHVVGDHERDVIGDVFKGRAHTGPKWARGRRSRQNISSPRSSTSAKRGPSVMSLRGGAANKKDHSKTDCES